MGPVKAVTTSSWRLRSQGRRFFLASSTRIAAARRETGTRNIRRVVQLVAALPDFDDGVDGSPLNLLGGL
jgi:hypothetical protein